MPVVAGPPAGHGGQAPSVFDKMKMGAMMGGTVGLTIGFLFGSYSMIKTGIPPNGIIRTLGQYMAGSAATFGFFMSIGSVIRTEEGAHTSNEMMQAFARSRGAPILMAFEQEKARRRNE